MKILLRTLPLICILIVLFNCTQKPNKSQIEYKYTNDLVKETSPYLLQHAHNPVNWKAWNNKTLEQAKKENKLILISVGYSSCHWCHVMEEESFENEDVAKLMNDNFVSIKVDREERPDIDQVYMSAVELMTGSGGWPLNCIALPDGRPVFGGTYFTKKEWMQALNQLAGLYKDEPEKIIAYADRLEEGIKNSDLITVNKEDAIFKKEDVVKAVTNWTTFLDFKEGGEKSDTKFPKPNNLSFLLRKAVEEDDLKIKQYVETTLTKMAYGGIYDQIGGGFSRYSTDKSWHIPHFEKMLYDNAQLVSVYSDAYLVSKNELYKEVVEETLAFIERKMLDKSGAFYSALDADSKNEKEELEEGAFYVWTKEELKTHLGKDYNLFKDYYNVNNKGFWEKKNFVLIKDKTDTNFAKENNISQSDLLAKIKDWKTTLLKVRSKRERPGLDKKALTSWNGLMLKGYVDAYRVFNNKHYLDIAIKNGEFILKSQLKKDGSLYRSYINKTSSINAYSEDYAMVIDGFISLYQVTLDEKWLKTANKLMHYTVAHFYDNTSGLFFFTSNDDASLITRKTDVLDRSIPSSNSVLAKNMFKLSHYFDNSHFKEKAKQMLNTIKPSIIQAPTGYSNWLDLMSNYTGTYYEFAISGKNALNQIKTLNQYYLTNVLIAGASKESDLPLMKARFVEDLTLIYVCVDSACKLPVTDVHKAVGQLKK